MSLASSAATSCKTSHSCGVSTAICEVSKSFFISCDEMIRGNQFSAGELNVVFEVRPSRGESMVEDRLVHWDKLNPLQDRLRMSAGSRLVRYSPPEKINQWKGERRCPALEFLRPTCQVEHAETFAPTAPLRHHVNEDIDVDENLQSANLRAIVSRMRVLSSVTGFSGWIPTRARRSGSMGTLGQCFDNTLRSVSPRPRIASSRSFCSRSDCSCRSRVRKVAMSSSRTRLSTSSSCAGVFAILSEIIDGGGSKGQARPEGRMEGVRGHRDAASGEK